MSPEPIKGAMDKCQALAAEQLRAFRVLRSRLTAEKGAQKFRTSLEMEAAHHAWLEQRARHAELYRAYIELFNYD
jgi:hypothetical protein